MTNPQDCDHLLATGPAFTALELHHSEAATEAQRSTLRDDLVFERGINWYSYCPYCGVSLAAIVTAITEYTDEMTDRKIINGLPLVVDEDDVDILIRGAHVWNMNDGPAVSISGSRVTVVFENPLHYFGGDDLTLFEIYGNYSSIDATKVKLNQGPMQ